MSNMKFKVFLLTNSISYATVAKLLKINISSFSRKINGHTPFSAIEIATICKHYNLDANEIFFNDLLLKR